MSRTMADIFDRRQKIFSYIADVRETSYEKLMNEFKISRKTLWNDLKALGEAPFYVPFTSDCGRYGSVKVSSEWRGKYFLSPMLTPYEQQAVVDAFVMFGDYMDEGMRAGFLSIFERLAIPQITDKEDNLILDN